MLEISFSPETEGRLRDRAREMGLFPSDYVRRIVEEAVGDPKETVKAVNGSHRAHASAPSPFSSRGTLPPAEIERRRAALQRLAGSVNVPGPVDDSRESIYEDDADGR